ncbi:MAG: SIMPL domain-containing protein [Pseudomonadota bacterium]
MTQAHTADPQRQIPITATASIMATPDQVRLRSGVVTVAETAKAALSENSAAMGKVIAALKAAGIAAADIATEAFQIAPQYKRSKVSSSYDSAISAYRVSNVLSVFLRDVDTVGAIIDVMVEGGINRFDSSAFEVSDADTRRDEARSKAVALARQRAELYARAAGVTLGKIVRITEGRASFTGGMERGAVVGMAASVPIEAGEREISASVTIVWEID